ncbi:hypothetical protein SO802_026905 [Lithocarpus litseifolius]|uniref:Desiccation-related protein PCC13-62 n=1 Tax=Lithocarpus litseifolius TaxID=425828 RepID=A0AAW2C6F2_9ROSI
MALTATSTATITTLLVSLLFLPKFYSFELIIDYDYSSISKSDVDLLEFPLNLEFLEAEFFLHGSLGYGLDKFAPNLTKRGPFKKQLKGFPRPLLDLSAASFAKVVDRAFGRPLAPPFDPYTSGLNFLLASYLIPYVGLTGYVGANSKLQAPASKRLVAGLLAVESGQDAIIRALLYERATVKVPPYGITVAEFTDRFSELRNKLGHAGFKDEGLVVPPVDGAEGKIIGNVLAGNRNSIAFERSPEEVLRIVYGGGNEHKPGGFYPKGAKGRIARSHLHSMPTA